MLPKSERFTKEDFKGIRPKVFFRGDVFDLAFLLLPEQKFACVVSKKTFRRAVDRNIIKRRLFNYVAQAPRTFTQSIVFYPKKKSLDVTSSQLISEIQKAFDTLH